MKRSYAPAVVLPQVEKFVATHIATICTKMKTMEAADNEARLLTYEWHLTGRRPKVRDSRHFANMVNVSLKMQLYEAGFQVHDIMGIVGTMTFHIHWFPQR